MFGWMREGQWVRFRPGSKYANEEQRGRIVRVLPPGVGERKEPVCIVEHGASRKRRVLYVSELIPDSEGDAGLAMR